jgi:hypothetical protein
VKRIGVQEITVMLQRRSATNSSAHENHAAAAEFATDHGLEHEHSRRKLAHQWDFYPFGVGNWRRARNVVHGALHGRSITAFHYHFALLADSVEDNGYQRDSLHRFLVCVVDLDHPVPSLAAVRTERLDWHGGELPWPAIEVKHERWSEMFTLSGPDADFGHAVVTVENAERCAQADTHAEWRFEDAELLLWVRGGRVDETLAASLDVARALILAAERYPQTR